METPKNPIITAIDDLNKRQQKIAKTLSDITLDHTTRIVDLAYRCGVLEAIQIRLFSVLAETNPLVHKQVVEELRDSLQHVELKGGQHTAFADHLRALVGSQPGKKVHLKLVPKKVSPATPKPDHS
jgi:hypothetical protein